MPWAKVDDGWWCHPKVLGLDLAARGLWVSALSWSCAQRRAVVPRSLVAMLGGDEANVKQLEAAGLWDAHPDGWEIHDWAEYQQQSLSEKRAEAGRKGGKKSRPPAETEAKPKQSRSNGEANAEAGTRPVPSRPDPSSSLSSQSDPLPEPLPVDRVMDEIAQIRLDGQNGVRSPKAWLARCRENLPGEVGDEVARLVEWFDASPRELAEVVEGKRDTRWLKRRPEAGAG